MSKKILIADSISSILKDNRSFLNREDIEIITASTKDEALALHKELKTDLIVIDLDMQGMTAERFCEIIRNDETLQKVSIIISCTDADRILDECEKCRTNVCIGSPPHSPVLLQKAQQLLQVQRRVFYRTNLGVKVEGIMGNKTFLAHSANISASGMLFETGNILKKGDLLKCGFYLPDGTHVRSSAEVVRLIKDATRHDIHMYGIRFLDLSPDLKSAIEAYVNSETGEEP